jgi:hypothetical protein
MSALSRWLLVTRKKEKKVHGQSEQGIEQAWYFRPKH